MRNRALLVFAAVVCLLFQRCGESVVGEGGGATETINCKVVCSAGEPDSGAVVRLIDAGNWFEKRQSGISVVLDSAVTGKDGLFSFEYDTGYICNIQVDGDSEAAFVRDMSSLKNDTSALQIIVLQSAASFGGSLDSGSTVSRVELFGTTYSASVQGHQFIIPDMAAGVYPLLLVTDEEVYHFGNTAEIEEGADVTVRLGVDESVLVIDDFEGDFQLYYPSKLGLITGGNWYVYDDSQEADSNTSFINIGTFEQDAFRGKSLSARAVLGNGAEYPFTGLGVNVLSRGLNCDFSTVDSVSFWARGNCTVYFSVETEAVDSINWSPHFGRQIVLTDTWTEFTVQMESITVPPDCEVAKRGIVWDDVKHAVKRIEFDLPYGTNTLGDTLRFELDDIYIYGALIEDLLP